MVTVSVLALAITSCMPSERAAACRQQPTTRSMRPSQCGLREHGSRSAMQHKARCAIEAPGSADGVRRLAGGMARAYRYQAGPNLSSLAARPTERSAYN